MKTKSAMITIAGRPNVGKSTLTNYLVGEKIAIVSNKPQTTRNRICGIVTRGDTQFVFVDTPGYHRARTKLGDYMVNVARESISDVDLTILVVEPIASIGPQEEGLIDKIKSSHCPAILAINKIDTVEKDALLEVIAVYSQAAAFDAIIPISAKTGDGTKHHTPFCFSMRTKSSNRLSYCPYSSAPPKIFTVSESAVSGSAAVSKTVPSVHAPVTGSVSVSGKSNMRYATPSTCGSPESVTLSSVKSSRRDRESFVKVSVCGEASESAGFAGFSGRFPDGFSGKVVDRFSG